MEIASAMRRSLWAPRAVRAYAVSPVGVRTYPRSLRSVTTQHTPPKVDETPAPSVSRALLHILAWVPVALFLSGHVASLASVKGTSMSVRVRTNAADV